MIKFEERKLLTSVKGKGFSIWNQIKNPKVKYAESILDLAWKRSREIDYKNFPEYFQKEKYKEMNKVLIRYLSEDVQKDIIKDDSEALGYVSEQTRIEYLRQNPKKCEEYYKHRYSEIEKVLDLKENPQTLAELTEDTQKYFIENNPNNIYYVSKEMQREILTSSKIQDKVWKHIIAKDQNLSLEKWKKYFKLSASYQEKDYEEFPWKIDQKPEELLRGAFTDFWNSREQDGQKAIISEIKNSTDLDKQYFVQTIERFLKQGNLQPNQQKEVLTLLSENEDIIGKEYANINYWDLGVIEEKFSDKYGKEKLLEYQDIILQMKKGEIAPPSANRMIRLFFKENSIIERVEPKKVIQYIKLYDEYSKDTHQRDLKLMIKEQKVKESFRDIMSDAFGEESLKVLDSRPGLNLFNIENTEVFNENIMHHFSREFIDDCLSYHFANYNSWIAQMQDKEQLDAFKLYFEITSKQLGENTTTMQICFTRYNEFKTLLKDAASKDNLTEEQQISLGKLCMWPANICKVNKVEDLENINEKLSEKLQNLSEKEKKEFRIKSIMTKEDIQEKAFLYPLDSIECMQKANLSQTEMQVLRFLSENNFDINTVINSGDLEDKLGIFMNSFSGINKIQDNQIEELNNQFTNMDKIDEAIKNKEYGVKKIEVDGFTFLDLGTMPVSFASHNPNMNNSELKHMKQDGEQLSKEGLENYLSYEEEDGISTISAVPINNLEDDFHDDRYIYWNLSENEVVGLSEVDGQVSHNPKLPVSHRLRKGSNHGRVNVKLKDYKTINGKSGEIAFYRRKRIHKKSENQKFGRKILPDAVALLSEYDVLKRFKKPIPIILKRGSLSNIDEKEFIQTHKESIEKAKQKIKEEEQIPQNQMEEDAEIMTL